MEQYCKKCIMKYGDPGIEINDDGLCNQCSGEEIGGALQNMRSIVRDALEFKSFIQESTRSKNKVDCMLMLSGGKDSINMLKILKKEYNANVLAFSINHPFESNVATQNIKKAVEKLDVEHILLTPKISDYFEIISSVYKTENVHSTSCGSRAKYKVPCLVCTAYMQIKSFIYAMKYGIKYILYCADQFQMAHIQKDIDLVVEDVYELLGDRCFKIFGQDFEFLLHKKNDKPKIIYPYAIVDRYDVDEIIAELNREGLYDSTPIQTHCSLFALLSYYSYKNYNMYFYAPELSYEVRNGKMSRQNAMEFSKRLKTIILEIAVKPVKTESEVQYIKETFSLIYSLPEQIEVLTQYVLDMYSFASKMNISLNNKENQDE